MFSSGGGLFFYRLDLLRSLGGLGLFLKFALGGLVGKIQTLRLQERDDPTSGFVVAGGASFGEEHVEHLVERGLERADLRSPATFVPDLLLAEPHDGLKVVRIHPQLLRGPTEYLLREDEVLVGHSLLGFGLDAPGLPLLRIEDAPEKPGRPHVDRGLDRIPVEVHRELRCLRRHLAQQPHLRHGFERRQGVAAEQLPVGLDRKDIVMLDPQRPHDLPQLPLGDLGLVRFAENAPGGHDVSQLPAAVQLHHFLVETDVPVELPALETAHEVHGVDEVVLDRSFGAGGAKEMGEHAGVLRTKSGEELHPHPGIPAFACGYRGVAKHPLGLLNQTADDEVYSPGVNGGGKTFAAGTGDRVVELCSVRFGRVLGGSLERGDHGRGQQVVTDCPDPRLTLRIENRVPVLVHAHLQRDRSRVRIVICRRVGVVVLELVFADVPFLIQDARVLLVEPFGERDYVAVGVVGDGLGGLESGRAPRDDDVPGSPRVFVRVELDHARCPAASRGPRVGVVPGGLLVGGGVDVLPVATRSGWAKHIELACSAVVDRTVHPIPGLFRRRIDQLLKLLAVLFRVLGKLQIFLIASAKLLQGPVARSPAALEVGL